MVVDADVVVDVAVIVVVSVPCLYAQLRMHKSRPKRVSLFLSLSGRQLEQAATAASIASLTISSVMAMLG